jgi:lipopolysaccharide export system permease protein
MLKQLDKLMFKSFIGPFVVSFGIALFVLVIQFLWLYIDEIAGKGVSIFVLLELIGYLSVSTFPMALPIAVLIASVMVMGNMAERYELSSVKSAGVSLLRIMVPLIFAGAMVAGFSYFCSDVLIPKANLQFRSRLFDIRKQKPALTIEKGVFNEDFRQFVIRVGEKAKDGETIGSVLIEDQTSSSRSKMNQILADSGQMFTSGDKRYFVMNLFNGTQYQEPALNTAGQKQKYPFIRTNFQSWSKVWNMSEFDMTSTDRDRFKSQRAMLSVSELRQSVDSLHRIIAEGKQGLADELLLNVKRQPVPTTPKDSQLLALRQPVPDQDPRPKAASRTSAGLKLAKTAPSSQVPSIERIKSPTTSTSIVPESVPRQDSSRLDSFNFFWETYPPHQHARLREDAVRLIKQYQTTVETKNISIQNRRLESVKTGYDLYTKQAFAWVCIIFLFIGGPMGAIIRKGGFGYPILVSISFFVTFIFLTIFCRKLAESFVMPPFWAAMMPCLIFVPLATVLTRRAMDDAQLLSLEPYQRAWRNLRNWLGKKRTTTEQPSK